MKKDAKLSRDRKYRYVLTREWNDGPSKGIVNFICLNPSTADETEDDPTVRRCIGFAKAWGFEGIAVTNLFALRATDPKALQEEHINPIGDLNDSFLKMWARKSTITVAAWGTHGALLGRGQQVKAMMEEFTELRVFGLTQEGHPRHPLYLPKTLVHVPWK